LTIGKHRYTLRIMIKKSIPPDLRPTDRKALTCIRNRIMHRGAAPSVRELASEMGFASPRSATLIIDRLIDLGYLRRREDRMLQLVRMPADAPDRESTVEVPLVGRAACGAPLLAEQNIEAMIPVSTLLARPGQKYFLLRANGDSMNEAGIENGALVLVRRQQTAESGQVVVALIDDEATIKELQLSREAAVLRPRTNNPVHRPIVLTRDFQVQGIVVATIPSIDQD
jgi:repressor LexA